MRIRATSAAALAVLIALAPALVLPALAADAGPPDDGSGVDLVAGAPKVVIVVGATHEHTASYRADANEIYAEAIKHTPNVIKVYSPNATWPKVKAAAQGASILIYLGHGSGFPKTTNAVFDPKNHDGMGLNSTTNPSDNVAKYFGEYYMAKDIRLAKDAVVMLSHLCYASGNSEQGQPQPSYAIARERIDNFASGFLRAGARAVIADTWTEGVISYIESIFTTDQTIGEMWTNSPSDRGHQMPFVPMRNPAYQAAMDPNDWHSGFYRSIVGAYDMRTTDVVAGAGAAATGTGPTLWSMDGPRTITPNFDGVADRLNLVARFSGNASWSVQVRNGADEVVRTQAGSGHQAFITWDTLAGVVAPAGEYTWHLHASDANGSSDESGTFDVVDEATPDAGVLAFKPGTTTTRSSTINYTLTFAGPVSGLTVYDLRRTGTARSCQVGAPVGGPAVYTVQVTNCTTGSVTLTLHAGTVIDGAATYGPLGPIIAPRVIIDRSAPTVAGLRPMLTSGVQLASASATASLPIVVGWTGKDSGAGVASYDIKRNVAGGAYTTLATGQTAASLAGVVKPGATWPGSAYQYKVRARDKAGNLGAWYGPYPWRAALIQQNATSVKLTGAWAAASGSAHSGGSVKSASVAGASASLTFQGRSVAWVTTLRPGGGEARVYIDGALAATIDTYADTVSERYVAFSRSWTGWGKHTIRIVVVGTAGRPQVTLDAFATVG